jgi:amino acid adenylation domain-containing protein
MSTVPDTPLLADASLSGLAAERVAAVLPHRDFVRFPLHETGQTLAQRFEKQVRRFPHRLAVKTRQEELTYAQLDALANRTAQAIMARSGHLQLPVVILLEQGAGLVGAIIGVLKAGRPYVGLDPAHPAAVLRQTLAHCGADLIITNQANYTAAAALASDGQTLIDLESPAGSSPAVNPHPPQSPDDPAYIYYTSGSTGTPKGVVDSHRNVLHNVMRYTNNLQIDESDRLTLLQSVAFSGAVSSLFCALLNGATCFPIDLRRESMEDLGAWLSGQGITVYHSVPSIFQRLLATGMNFPSFRVIRLEGDQSALHHVELFKARFGPEVTLVNGLGATETGISHQFPVRHDTVIMGSVVPVGYATADMRGLILDPSGAELPPGQVGEIAIRSRYLATGYWRQPELTAKRFLHDPAGGDERIYLTGDLGRKGSDGCLEVLGRTDHSLKIHGRWIDVPALELALTRIDGITAAVVTLQETSPGNPQLVAYVVASGPSAPSVGMLRRALSGSPSAEAVPARIVRLSALPLDPNGKINRKALPRPDNGRPELSHPYVAPATSLERDIAQIWARALGLEQIGRHDDFGELGGDSLQATEITLQVEKQFGLKLPPSFILSAPTIAAMAQRLIRPDSGKGLLVPITTQGTGSPFFCLHDGYGDVLAYRELARLLGADRPVYGLRARGMDGRELPCDRVEDMARLHVEEIRQVQPKGPYYLGGNCFGGALAFETARQLLAAGEPIGLLVLMDASFPIGRLRSRLQWHLHRVRRSPVPAGASHLVRLVGRMLKRTGSKLYPSLLRPFLNQVASAPVPASRQVVAANARAWARYRPRPLEAPAVQICVGPPHNHLGWRNVLWPGPRIVSLPADGSDLQFSHIVLPPHVGRLAGALREILREAEAHSRAGRKT